MKKLLITGFLSLLAVGFLSAQKTEFKLTKKTGVLEMSLSNVLVQGYDGNEVIFSTPKKEDNIPDERAKGLQLLSESGLKDNTGLNLNVEQDGNVTRVAYVAKNQTDSILVKVPNSLSLRLVSDTRFNGKPITIQDFKGELEVNTNYNPIALINVTGPVTAKSLYGGLTARFSQPVKGPISLISVYGFVDVSVPENLKANLSLGTQFGNIYAAKELQIKQNKETKAEKKDNSWNTPTATRISGTLNGGGLDLIVESTYGKIYLRKL